MTINLPAFRALINFRQGWIRIAWKDTRPHPLLFSERNGHCKRLALGSWSFRYLPKWNAKQPTPP